VLDIGPRDSRLAEALAGRGITRYLGLVEPGVLSRVRSQAGELGSRFHPFEDVTIVTRSSADLLVLRGDHARAVWGWSSLGRFRWVAVEQSGRGARWEAELAARVAMVRGRMRPRGRWRVDGVGSFSVFELDMADPVAPRIYFSPVWGVPGLAQRLADAGLEYAVLRWFDDLPVIEPGEDLDILVSDGDVEAFRRVVESEPGTQPIDLYSVSGLEGSDFRGAAYYVPELARRILANAVVHESGVMVPAVDDHLHSLAYHAVYHKGASSGLAATLVETDPAPEHDYRKALDDIAATSGHTFPGTMEAIDDYLEAVGWRPPVDALRRLSVENDWLRRRLGGPTEQRTEGPELAVFLVRERTREVLSDEEVLAVLARWGFEVLFSRLLDESGRDEAARTLRGGNWGKGPYPVSGGRPALVVACLHYAPSPVGDGLRHRYPHLSNEDVYYVKQEMRDLIDARVGADAAFNAVHSADDESESRHYLAVLAPDALAEITDEQMARERSQTSRADVVRTLSRGRRARVDVVETGHGLVVRKTYTAGASRHLSRELGALTDLSDHVAAVPPVGARGDRWFTMPLYENVLPPSGLLPLPVLREMVDVLRDIRAHGYVVVDAKPDNFVQDPREGLKIVDLEFAYPVSGADEPLARGPEFVEPVPGGYQEVPAGDSSYEVRWLPRTGLPLAVLLDAPASSQRLHRGLYRLRTLTISPGSPMRASLARARRMVGRLRPVASSFRARRAWGRPRSQEQPW